MIRTMATALLLNIHLCNYNVQAENRYFRQPITSRKSFVRQLKRSISTNWYQQIGITPFKELAKRGARRKKLERVSYITLRSHLVSA